MTGIFFLRLRLRKWLLFFFLSDKLRMFQLDVLVEASLTPIGFLAAGDDAFVIFTYLIRGSPLPLIPLLGLTTVVLIVPLLNSRY